MWPLCPHLSFIVLNGFQHTVKSSLSYILPPLFSLCLGGAPPDFTIATSVDDEISPNVTLDPVPSHSRTLSILLQVLPKPFNPICMYPRIVLANEFKAMVHSTLSIPEP